MVCWRAKTKVPYRGQRGIAFIKSRVYIYIQYYKYMVGFLPPDLLVGYGTQYLRRKGFFDCSRSWDVGFGAYHHSKKQGLPSSYQPSKTMDGNEAPGGLKHPWLEFPLFHSLGLVLVKRQFGFLSIAFNEQIHTTLLIHQSMSTGHIWTATPCLFQVHGGAVCSAVLYRTTVADRASWIISTCGTIFVLVQWFRDK